MENQISNEALANTDVADHELTDHEFTERFLSDYELTDHELLSQFERATLPLERFRHFDHVWVAFLLSASPHP